MNHWKNFLIVALFLFAAPAFAVKTGDAAPNFVGESSTGEKIKLSKFKDNPLTAADDGKVVVLEWLNYGCPFVKKHYNDKEKNMQKLQEELTGKGVVWISVISSAEGKQGYVTAAEAEKDRKEHGSKATSIVLDPSGRIGRLYGAKTTPHMFVIDTKGKLIYQGAIDDKPSSDVADIAGARNYVRDAVNAVVGKTAVATAETQAYGCGVKYSEN